MNAEAASDIFGADEVYHISEVSSGPSSAIILSCVSFLGRHDQGIHICVLVEEEVVAVGFSKYNDGMTCTAPKP